MDRISAKDYRKQFIEPVVQNGPMDDLDFKEFCRKKDKQLGVKELGLSEHQVQKRILERLSFIKGGFFWRENSGMVKQTDKFGKTRMWRAGIKGIADIMGVYQGKMVAIEVKAKGKKASVDQKAFLQRVRECGGVGFVCDDDTLVLELLKESML